MKRVLCVMNDHPEVGKTAFGSALNASLRRQGFQTTFLAVGDDTDIESCGVPYDASWNIIENHKAKDLLNWTEDSDVVICDVETGYAEAFTDFHDAEDLSLVLGDYDIELTIILPQVDEVDCNEAIQEVSAALSDSVYYVVARIPADEFSSHLQPWEDSEASSHLDYFGATIVEVPRISDTMSETIDGWEVTLADALGMEFEALPEDVSKMVSAWNTDFDHQLEEAIDYLLPEKRRKHGFRRSA